MRNVIPFILMLGVLLNQSCNPQSNDGDDTGDASDYIFVGTYTKKEGHVDGKAEGIYSLKFNLETGELTRHGVTTGIINPSFLAISPDYTFLYAVSETGPDVGDKASVYAYKIMTEGNLKFLNKASSLSHYPCYVAVNGAQKAVYVANYVGGMITSHRVSRNGKLADAAPFFTLQGSGPNQRQDSSHPHSIIPDPQNKYVYAADLGTDKITVFKIHEPSGDLNLADIPTGELPAGSGPRHLAIHPLITHLYAVNELTSSITHFTIEQVGGHLSRISTVSSLPAGYDDLNHGADIHIHPNGRFLYASNRGHNSIAIFSIKLNGELQLLGHEPTRGEIPRNFMIHNNGDWLLVANQNSDNIVTFKIGVNGGLTFTSEINIPTPVCLKQL